MNNIEEKITQLFRETMLQLKNYLISYNKNFPWISFSEEKESKEPSGEFSTYGWLDKEKDVELLNNDEKLKEELKKKVPSFPQSLIWGLNFQLTPKICQKDQYDSSNLIIKRELDFQKLDYSGLIDLFKEVDLSKNKKWICFLPIELFKLTEGKNKHFKVKKNLLHIIALPLGNSFQIIFAEISSPLLTYQIGDLFCQENWNNIRKNCLFLVVKLLYNVAEVKGRLIAIANARPIKHQTPYLDKCQTCQKTVDEERKVWGAKRVEFSDSWYRFCSKDCIRDYDRWEALERGESIENYLKREQEKKILTQKAIKKLEERNDKKINDWEKKNTE